MTAADARQHRIGLALVAMAALAWSSSGFFIRVIGTDLMTMLFWRGLFSGSAVFVLFFFIERKRAWGLLKAMRWPAFAVAGLTAIGMISGIGSMRFTSVADAMVIYATLPFITAGLAYVTIAERPSRSTLLAGCVALAGVGVMLWGSEPGGSLFGKVLALIMTCAMASFTTLMRRHREVQMLPAMGLSAWICAAACFFFAQPLGVTAADFGLIVLFGILQNAAGLAFYTFGSKHVPAAEATLIAALEVPLTPFWVFLFLGERPAPQTLIGGAIVLTALFAHMTAEFRAKPALAT